MLNFTMGAIDFSGVNRTFALMYKGVIEKSVATIDENGIECAPYYVKSVLKQNVTDYFDTNLPKYVTHYQASIYYFSKNNGTICTSKYCSAVRITLKADINYLFKYEKARDFYIANSKTI